MTRKSYFKDLLKKEMGTKFDEEHVPDPPMKSSQAGTLADCTSSHFVIIKKEMSTKFDENFPTKNLN